MSKRLYVTFDEETLKLFETLKEDLSKMSIGRVSNSDVMSYIIKEFSAIRTEKESEEK